MPVPGALSETVTVVVFAASVPPLLVADIDTVYSPDDAYVWDGFCAVEVEPSPKFHDQAVGVFVEVSVNVTLSGAAPDVGEVVNDATGSGDEVGTSPT